MSNKLKVFLIRNTLLAPFVFFLVFPISKLVGRINASSLQIFKSSVFKMACLNSIVISLFSAAFSLAVALLIAISISRANIKYKKLFTFILTCPMLLPTISHGSSLLMLFGNNGLFTNLIGTSPIYGVKGIVLGSVLFTCPMAIIILLNTLRLEPQDKYEAADILGVCKLQQFCDITLPYLRRTMCSLFVVIYSLVIADYGIPMMVGGKIKTLSILIYEDVLGFANYDDGVILACVMLLFSICGGIGGFRYSNGVTDSVYYKNTYRQKNRMDFYAFIILTILSILVTFQILAFMLVAFSTSYPLDLTFTLEHLKYTIINGGFKNLLTSIQVSFMSCLLGTLLSFATAYFTVRIRPSIMLDILSTVPAVVPGVVLGISYALQFSGTFFYKTVWLLTCANIIHFYTFSYTIFKNTFLKLNHNLEDVGKTLGISRVCIIFDVILPHVRHAVLSSMLYYFVNSMITISAVSFLAGVRLKPISLLISQYEHQNQIENIAVVTLLIFLVNILFCFSLTIIPKGFIRKSDHNSNLVSKR